MFEWSHHSTVHRSGLGVQPEAGASVLSVDLGGLLQAETADAGSPAEEATPPAVGVNFTPPAPSIEVTPPAMTLVEPAKPIVTVATGLTQEMPQPLTKEAAQQARKSAKSARAASGSSHVTGRAGGGRSTEAGRGGGGDGFIPPQFLLRHKPAYPEQARAQGLEGLVLLLVAVDETGRVTSVRLQRSCGHAALDRSALEAVRSWRFSPARQMDRAIPATVEIPIRFSIEA